MLSRIILFFAVISIAQLSYGQSSRKYSNEFLKIGVGARAFGMGNSVAASVSDVTSGYWNPAGLQKMSSDFQVALMHSEYFAGIAKYDYGAFATHIDSISTIGISVVRFGVDDIMNTTELIDNNGNIDYNRISSFSASDYAFMFTYSRKSNIEGLNYGGNVKVIHRNVGDFADAWGFGFDLGMQYSKNRWMFGAMARDITGTFNAWDYSLDQEMIDAFLITGNEIPQNDIEVTVPTLVLGAARAFDLGRNFGLLAEMDMDLTFDGMRNTVIKSDLVSVDPHLGVEASYKNMFFLRLGVGNFQMTTDFGLRRTTYQPNFGVGVKLKNVTIDYALTDIGDRSVGLYSNVFSLKLDINKK